MSNVQAVATPHPFSTDFFLFKISFQMQSGH